MALQSHVTRFQVLLRVKEVIGKLKSFDLNWDGKIPRSEIIEVFGYVPSDEEVRRRIGTTDSCINRQEFIRANTGDMNVYGTSSELQKAFKLNVYGTSSELQKAFKLMDVDKSGHVTADQLHTVLKRLGDPAFLDDCRQFMAALHNDGDGNGKVTFDEFQLLLPTGNTTPAY